MESIFIDKEIEFTPEELMGSLDIKTLGTGVCYRIGVDVPFGFLGDIASVSKFKMVMENFNRFTEQDIENLLNPETGAAPKSASKA